MNNHLLAKLCKYDSFGGSVPSEIGNYAKLKTEKEFWEQCTKVDWLFRFLEEKNWDHKLAILIASAYARKRICNFAKKDQQYICLEFLEGIEKLLINKTNWDDLQNKYILVCGIKMPLNVMKLSKGMRSFDLSIRGNIRVYASSFASELNHNLIKDLLKDGDFNSPDTLVALDSIKENGIEYYSEENFFWVDNPKNIPVITKKLLKQAGFRERSTGFWLLKKIELDEI